MRRRLTIAAVSAAMSASSLPAQELPRGLPARDVEQYAGLYVASDGETLAISLQRTPFGVFPLLSIVPSGTLRLLFPAARDTFVAGPELARPEPVARHVLFHRDGGGAVSRLELRDASGGHPPRIARRVELARESFVVRRDSVVLPGELVRPRGTARAPAVVLAHGSEDSDRHSFGALPFVLAHHGIAALALDKRGTGDATGSWESSGIEELALDIAAAVGRLREHSGIDPDRVCILGFSEGGWIAPRAAAEGGVTCIVAITGGGRTKGDAFIYKNRRIAEERGLAGAALDSAIADAQATIRESVARTAAGGGSGFDRRVSYDPQADWRAFRGPVLVLLGGEDVLEDAPASAEWLRALFRQAENPDFAVRLFPGAHHGILVGAEPVPSAFARMQGMQGFDPAYWETLLGWLKTRLGVADVREPARHPRGAGRR